MKRRWKTTLLKEKVQRELQRKKLRIKETSETQVIDTRFLEEMERGLTALEAIMSRPKNDIKSEREAVFAGKARRIDEHSIAHLASHGKDWEGVEDLTNIQKFILGQHQNLLMILYLQHLLILQEMILINKMI